MFCYREVSMCSAGRTYDFCVNSNTYIYLCYSKWSVEIRLQRLSMSGAVSPLPSAFMVCGGTISPLPFATSCYRRCVDGRNESRATPFMPVLTRNILKFIEPGFRVRADICIASDIEASVVQSIMWLSTERLGFKYRQGHYGFCYCKIGFGGRGHRRPYFLKQYLLSLLMIISGDSETGRVDSVGIMTQLKAEWRRN